MTTLGGQIQMDARRFDEVLRHSATSRTPRRALVKGLAGAALAGGIALGATSNVAAGRCEDRQKQICKERYAKGDPLGVCKAEGYTQGQCIQACYEERVAYFCSS